MKTDPAYTRYALAEVGQRLGALLIDLLSIWFLTELVEALIGVTDNSFLGLTIFCLMWGLFRILVVNRNQGQSFGRWLMSLRVVDYMYGKTAGVSALVRRELVILIAAFILLETITTTLVVFSWLPLAFDIAFAIADSAKRQSFHDRLSGTIVIQSRKGFQLDQRLTRIFGQVTRRTAEFYQPRNPEEADYDAPPRGRVRPRPSYSRGPRRPRRR
ncbi:MAG: RDD family protein [Oscillatoriales cyanobacterium SM2_2_1]|nr:RDD family protein [Oscillatoriales cyanobacterium SM2_2_1]